MLANYKVAGVDQYDYLPSVELCSVARGGNHRNSSTVHTSVGNSPEYARAGATHRQNKVPRMFFVIRTQTTYSASVMGLSLLSLR